VAYELKPLNQRDDEEKERQQQLGLGGLAPWSGAQSVGVGPASSGANTGANSGRFVNFDRYLAANQSGAQQSANAVSETVGKQAKKAEQAVGIANRTQGERIATNTATVPTVGSYYNPLSKKQQSVVGAPTDSQLQSLAGFQYRDPGSIVNTGEYANAVAAVADAKPAVDATGTQAGLQTLLQDQNGSNGNYTAGTNRLDAALTGAAGAGQFAELRSKFGGLEKMLSDSITSDATAREQARATSEASARYASGELGKRKAAADARAEADAAKAKYDEEMLAKVKSTPADEEDTAVFLGVRNGTMSEDEARATLDAKYGKGFYDAAVAEGQKMREGWAEGRRAAESRVVVGYDANGSPIYEDDSDEKKSLIAYPVWQGG
jgi:hypothetical protein